MQTKFITKVFPEGQTRLNSQLLSPVDCLILPLCQIKEGSKLVMPTSVVKLDHLLDGVLNVAIKSKEFLG